MHTTCKWYTATVSQGEASRCSMQRHCRHTFGSARAALRSRRTAASLSPSLRCSVAWDTQLRTRSSSAQGGDVVQCMLRLCSLGSPQSQATPKPIEGETS